MLNKLFKLTCTLLTLFSGSYIIYTSVSLFHSSPWSDSSLVSDWGRVISVVLPSIMLMMGMFLVIMGLFLLRFLFASDSTKSRYRPGYTRHEVKLMESKLEQEVQQHEILMHPDEGVISDVKKTHPRVSSELHIREIIASKARAHAKEIAFLQSSLEKAKRLVR